MPGRQDGFETQRKRAARTLSDSTETVLQKVRKGSEAEHSRGESRSEMADASPTTRKYMKFYMES